MSFTCPLFPFLYLNSRLFFSNDETPKIKPAGYGKISPKKVGVCLSVDFLGWVQRAKVWPFFGEHYLFRKHACLLTFVTSSIFVDFGELLLVELIVFWYWVGGWSGSEVNRENVNRRRWSEGLWRLGEKAS